VAATVQAFINDEETILALIANDQLERSLEDLREMESVLIDIDPEKEAMVPRPDPSEAALDLCADILDRAETELFEAYRGEDFGGVDSALLDVDPAPDVTPDPTPTFDGPVDGGEANASADADAESFVDLDAQSADPETDDATDPRGNEFGITFDDDADEAPVFESDDPSDPSDTASNDPRDDAFDISFESDTDTDPSVFDDDGDRNNEGAGNDENDRAANGGENDGVADTDGNNGVTDGDQPEHGAESTDDGSTDDEDPGTDIDDWGFGDVTEEGEN
jgi:flagellar protein FlaI